jgi:hypothetical protein
MTSGNRRSPLLAWAACAAVCAAAAGPARAVDYEYFKGQTCEELGKELAALQKAENEVKAKIKSADSKANTQAVVSTILLGWPFWGNVDHGDSNNMLAEIRTDLKYVTRAQKANKCN